MIFGFSGKRRRATGCGALLILSLAMLLPQAAQARGSVQNLRVFGTYTTQQLAGTSTANLLSAGASWTPSILSASILGLGGIVEGQALKNRQGDFFPALGLGLSLNLALTDQLILKAEGTKIFLPQDNAGFMDLLMANSFSVGGTLAWRGWFGGMRTWLASGSFLEFRLGYGFSL